MPNPSTPFDAFDPGNLFPRYKFEAEFIFAFKECKVEGVEGVTGFGTGAAENKYRSSSKITQRAILSVRIHAHSL